MRHAQLIQVEVRKCSTNSDSDEDEFLEEKAVQELLEQDLGLHGDSHAITGIGKGLALSAVLWVFLLFVVALVT
ncbi:MAG: hypothetical protein ACR2QQ_14300 [Gammaproteobacteria bacterium]